ncbi:MAG TPA: type II secretion system protein GspG [Thermoanaerobaculia bacterium]|jgi:type II secretory pathway pseudopilin PulG|nr:type II secretion system protein GspG [Thermoanaerobaculia bacterium]
MAFCAWCGNQVNQVSYAPCPRCGNPSNGSQRVAGTDNNTKTAGIVIGVLVGGLVIVAIIGILAAIAIPNFLTALQRSRQKRTMADMRTAAAAIEAYATDKNAYPDASPDLSELSQALTPTYTKTLPRVDGWGTALRYECWPKGACEHYALASAGADKLFEHESLQDYAPGTQTSNFDSDVVLSDGRFLQYPEGVQTQ